ncbi:MAG TPA: pantothenate kinase [Clostridiaceae bacterium]|nr:pantothenate kinase [Clostridiaceae bacterium]
MGVIVGLDIGGSTTKIVGFAGDTLLQQAQVKASNPVASAYGGLGSFLEENNLAITDIDEIRVTGVGASFLNGNLLERKTSTCAEFDSVGRGGLYLAKCDEAIVVSMGTGTSIVAARRSLVSHVIGSGVGGGTLAGLSNRMLNVRDVDTITMLAEDGDLANIDLTVGDLTKTEIPGLEPHTTASNFGKLSDLASQSDIALGIVNLVFQSVATASIMAARSEKLNTIVFTGYLTRMPAGHRVLENFSTLYGVNLLIPRLSEFATAIGAALNGRYR